MADVSLIFSILAADKTASGLNSAGGRMAKFKQVTSVAAVGILGAAAVMGKKAVEIASDTAESSSKVQTLLGASSKAAMDFANTSASAFGMSKREALGSVGSMAAVQVAMGASQEEASKLSVQYTQLSADLGSFNNASSAEVQEALTAALSGEYEMLKRYGIVVNDTTLKAEAMALGILKPIKSTEDMKVAQMKATIAQKAFSEAVAKHGPKSTEAMKAEVALSGATAKLGAAMEGKLPAALTAAQKKLASHAIIMRSTTAAQGDFARTSGGLANQSKIMSARMEDLQGKIGAKLLPAVVKVAGAFNGLLTWIDQNQAKAKVLGIIAVSLAGAVVATAAAIRIWAAMCMVATAATNLWTFAKKASTLAIYAQAAAIRIVWAAVKVWTAGQWLLNAALTANPIGLIVIGIVALIAIVVLIATKTTWFQQIWRAAWGAIKGAVSGALGWIKANWPLLLAILTGPIGLAVLFIVKNFDKIVSAVKAIPGKIKSAIGNVGALLVQAGKDFVRGFIVGIGQAIPNMLSAVGDMADKAVNWAKDRLRIGSPSRLTMQIGRWFSEGFAIGIKDKTADVVANVKTLVEKAKAKLDEVKGFAAQIRAAFSSGANVTSMEMGGWFDDEKPGESVIDGLRKKLAAAKEFVSGMAALRQRGLNATTLDQLSAAGPEGGLGAIRGLMMSDVGAVNSTVGQIDALGAGFGNSEAKRKFGIDPSKRQTVRVELNLTGADDDLLRRLRKEIRVKGGNVQVVLGKAS